MVARLVSHAPRQRDLELVCVRHGRTAWNRAGRFQGQSDTPLDRLGRAQARALGARLASERFDVAISSNLKRALDTAKIIGAAVGVTISEEPRLREMRFGSWEGLTWSQITERTPRTMVEPPSALQPDARAAPGGESFAELCARVQPVLSTLTARLPRNGRALIVSHAAVMHAILWLLLEGSSESALEIVLAPASILRLRCDGRTADVERDAAAPGRWTIEAVDGD